MIKKVWFENSKGDRLCGILSDSTKDKKFIVILCHGLRGSKDKNPWPIHLEFELNKFRIATFRFDFYGHGESEGVLEGATVSEATDDVTNAIKFLRKKGYEKIGLSGDSFGGVAVIIAAAKEKNIFILALESPGIGRKSYVLPQYNKDFQKKVWIKAGSNVVAPTIIVHGDADESVELWQATELARAIKGSRLEIIKGADHRYTNPKHFKRTMKLVVDFIVGWASGQK